MRFALGIFVAAMAGILPAPSAARAYVATPPPPSDTPVCGYCSGPPPPPTLVPTAAPQVVPPLTGGSSGPLPVARKAQINRATVSPDHVHRGHALKVSVFGRAGQAVVLTVGFAHHKPLVYRGKLEHSTTFVKSITVPQWAPLGRSSVKIALSGPAGSASTVSPYTMYFTVVR
ncbi:MAG: hypothetical protein NVSMB22_03690 [Chloroflexota bacterium]